MEIKIKINTDKQMKIIENIKYFKKMWNTPPPLLEANRISKEDYLKKINELKKGVEMIK